MRYEPLSTWIDSTDDVCPRPHHGHRIPTPGEMREAENNAEPRRLPPTRSDDKRHANRGYIMEPFAVQEGWESEADMWRFMVRKHRTIREMACALGVANMTVQRALKRFEIYRKRGRSFSK